MVHTQPPQVLPQHTQPPQVLPHSVQPAIAGATTTHPATTAAATWCIPSHCRCCHSIHSATAGAAQWLTPSHHSLGCCDSLRTLSQERNLKEGQCFTHRDAALLVGFQERVGAPPPFRSQVNLPPDASCVQPNFLDSVSPRGCVNLHILKRGCFFGP